MAWRPFPRTSTCAARCSPGSVLWRSSLSRPRGATRPADEPVETPGPQLRRTSLSRPGPQLRRSSLPRPRNHQLRRSSLSRPPGPNSGGRACRDPGAHTPSGRACRDPGTPLTGVRGFDKLNRRTFRRGRHHRTAWGRPGGPARGHSGGRACEDPGTTPPAVELVETPEPHSPACGVSTGSTAAPCRTLVCPAGCDRLSRRTPGLSCGVSTSSTAARLRRGRHRRVRGPRESCARSLRRSSLSRPRGPLPTCAGFRQAQPPHPGLSWFRQAQPPHSGGPQEQDPGQHDGPRRAAGRTYESGADRRA